MYAFDTDLFIPVNAHADSLPNCIRLSLFPFIVVFKEIEFGNVGGRLVPSSLGVQMLYESNKI